MAEIPEVSDLVAVNMDSCIFISCYEEFLVPENCFVCTVRVRRDALSHSYEKASFFVNS